MKDDVDDRRTSLRRARRRCRSACRELRPARATGASGLSRHARRLAQVVRRQQVLRGIDLHVPAGQFVAIVGRSGCGKSTLLRLLARARPADSGGEFWFGDGEGDARTRAPCASCSRSRGCCPGRACSAMSRSGSATTRRSPDARERALATLREVGLADRRDEWPSVLSGGQKQRVALARALVSRPRILAFDEPLGALDALTRIAMQRLLERVWRDQGFTAMLVTHDVAEAVALADRVVVIEDGEIALDLRVDLPRPRERGSVEVAELEGEILRHLFRNAQAGDDASSSDEATPILIVPGLGGSGPEHWQTHWERAFRARRVEQADWNRPVRADWLSRLAQALRDAPGAILVGHSLGCALIAHLAWRRPDSRSAERCWSRRRTSMTDRIPRDVRDFAPMPLARLPFPPRSSRAPTIPNGLERARALAQAWGTRFVNAGACGHINVAAGFGPWPAGEKLLADLMRETRATASKSLRWRSAGMRAS